MNYFVVAFVLVAGPLLVACYDEKYDKMDVDKILGDEALFTSYIDCLLDKGPCTAEHSAEFRKILPEVVETTCAKCTDIQKSLVRKSVKAIQERRPKEFEEFRNKYDPNGEHQKLFTAFVLATD